MILESILGSDRGLLLRSFLKIATVLATFKTYQTIAKLSKW